MPDAFCIWLIMESQDSFEVVANEQEEDDDDQLSRSRLLKYIWCVLSSCGLSPPVFLDDDDNNDWWLKSVDDVERVRWRNLVHLTANAFNEAERERKRGCWVHVQCSLFLWLDNVFSFDRFVVCSSFFLLLLRLLFFDRFSLTYNRSWCPAVGVVSLVVEVEQQHTIRFNFVSLRMNCVLFVWVSNKEREITRWPSSFLSLPVSEEASREDYEFEDSTLECLRMLLLFSSWSPRVRVKDRR
jgi:hypothetical protein